MANNWDHERSRYKVGDMVQWVDGGGRKPVERSGVVFHVGNPTTQRFWSALRVKLRGRGVAQSACKFDIYLAQGAENRPRCHDTGRGVVVAEIRDAGKIPHYRMPVLTTLRHVEPEVTLADRCADLLGTLGLPVPYDDGCLLDVETEELVLKGDNLRRALIAAGWKPPAEGSDAPLEAERDADMVIYLSVLRPGAQIARIEKNRHGPTGDVRLFVAVEG